MSGTDVSELTWGWPEHGPRTFDRSTAVEPLPLHLLPLVEQARADAVAAGARYLVACWVGPPSDGGVLLVPTFLRGASDVVHEQVRQAVSRAVVRLEVDVPVMLCESARFEDSTFMLRVTRADTATERRSKPAEQPAGRADVLMALLLVVGAALLLTPLPLALLGAAVLAFSVLALLQLAAWRGVTVPGFPSERGVRVHPGVAALWLVVTGGLGLLRYLTLAGL